MFKRCLALALTSALLVAASLPAQELKLASLGDFKLESGEVIRDCKIGYRTFGKLNSQKSNAILVPTWFTGTTQDLVGLVGPGKPLDPSKYYVILVDALGDGVSSSPSNSTLQPHMRFPRFTIRDMVRSEHQLVTEALGLRHLRAVMGISMGGMQTFEWIVSYPDFMDKAVPIVGSPQLASYDLLLCQTEINAIEEDADWLHGNYTSPPAAGMKTVAEIHALALTTPEYRVSQISREDFPKFLEATEQSALKGFDANNWIRQAQAMMAHDVSQPFAGLMEKAAGAVRAKLLVVVGLEDHMVNPRPALVFAKRLHAETLELNSPCGHLAFSCEQERVSRAVTEFLEK